MKASITTNKKKALTDIAVGRAKIRIFIRDEPHYQKDPKDGNTVTTRQLAKMLSIGFTNKQGFEVPARPFMKQFRAANKEDILKILRFARAKGFQGWKAQQQYQWAAEQIRDRLMTFLYTGQVTPANSPITLKRKTGDAPLVDTEQLLYAIDTEVQYAPVK